MKYLFALVMIPILIIVHEFGHMLVAKACRVAVPVFSVGFGRRLFGVQIGDTDFRVSSLPFGGYVRMAGADPYGYFEEEDALSDPSMSFLARPLWQRILVLLAGPLANVLFAVAVITAALMAGEPQAAAQVGDVLAGSPADRAGFQAGDEVLTVNGNDVSTWNQMSSAIGQLGKGPAEFSVRRSGELLALNVTIGEDDKGSFGLGHGRPSGLVGIDDPGSPAGRAGLQTGSLITAIGDADVADWVEIERALAAVGDVSSLTVQVRMLGADGRLEENARGLTLSRDGWDPPTSGAGAPSQQWGLYPATLFIETVTTTVSDEHGFLAGCRSAPHPRESPAAKAGLRQGDHLLSIDGAALYRWVDVNRGIAATMPEEGSGTLEARETVVRIRRAGKELELRMRPEIIEDVDASGMNRVRPIIGIGPVAMEIGGPEVRVYYSPLDAISTATDTIGRMAVITVERLLDVISLDASFDRSLGGPVAMFTHGAIAAEGGPFAMARFVAGISLSLGVVNLFPIPVLDGGQILFFLIEAIRGRPLPAEQREKVLQVAVIGMVLLMLMVTLKDTNELIGMVLEYFGWSA